MRLAVIAGWLLCLVVVLCVAPEGSGATRIEPERSRDGIFAGLEDRLGSEPDLAVSLLGLGGCARVGCSIDYAAVAETTTRLAGSAPVARDVMVLIALGAIVWSLRLL